MQVVIDNINCVFDELARINRMIRRYYTKVIISSDNYTVAFKLIYLQNMSIDGEWLFLTLDYISDLKLRIFDTTSISYCTKVPPSKKDKKFKKRYTGI